MLILLGCFNIKGWIFRGHKLNCCLFLFFCFVVVLFLFVLTNSRHNKTKLGFCAKLTKRVLQILILSPTSAPCHPPTDQPACVGLGKTDNVTRLVTGTDMIQLSHLSGHGFKTSSPRKIDVTISLGVRHRENGPNILPHKGVKVTFLSYKV